MFSFESKIIDATVKKLLNGEDYRQEVINDINVKFLDFTKNFIRNTERDFDREVDFKLYGVDGREYRCEVKLMGGGNPESADMVIARDSDIFIADTLSTQNKNQLNTLGISWLELRNHDNADIILHFKKILLRLDIPCA